MLGSLEDTPPYEINIGGIQCIQAYHFLNHANKVDYNKDFE